MFHKLLNAESTQLIIVIGTEIPDWVVNLGVRTVLIAEADYKATVDYHSEFYGKDNMKKWLINVCIEDRKYLNKLSEDTIFSMAKHSAQLVDNNGKVLIDLIKVKESKRQCIYLLSIYRLTNELCWLLYANTNAKNEVLNAVSEDFLNDVVNILGCSIYEAQETLRMAKKDYIEQIVKDSVGLTKSDKVDMHYLSYGATNNDIGFAIHQPLVRGPWNRLPNVTILKAPIGFGKTELAIDALRRCHVNDQKVAFITNLSAVVEDFKSRTEKCNPHKFSSMKDVKVVTSSDSLSEIESASHLATTLKSLWKNAISSFVLNADLVIVDECEKVYEALYSQKNNYVINFEKKLVRRTLYEVINSENTKSLWLDADISDSITRDITLNLMKASERSNKTKKIVTAEVLPICEKNNNSKISVSLNKFRAVEQTLLSKLNDGISKLFVVCDGKKTIENWLIDLGFEAKLKGGDETTACYEKARMAGVLVLTADPKSANREWHKEFLSDPDEQISKYRAVIASPVLSEGFSITKEFCDEVFAISTGMLTPKKMLQFSRRVRKAKKIAFGLNSYNKRASINFHLHTNSDDEKIEADLARRHKIILDNFHFSLLETLKAQKYTIVSGGEYDTKSFSIVRKSSLNRKAKEANTEFVNTLLNGMDKPSLNDVEGKRKYNAINIIRDALKIDGTNSIRLGTAAISDKEFKRWSCDTTYVAAYEELYEKRTLLNDVLVNNRMVTIGDNKPINTTRKINEILKLLGFNVKKSNSGKLYDITHSTNT
ncbi:DEAD/DEAH box helicase family protein [Vibrio tapetis]|nr:DEAD/DEAH box helicase family protein [Vibrio tapetis]